MSIIGRFSNLIKSNLNAAVDKLSDPAKEVDLLISEMEEELKKLRLELRDQIVEEKLAQKRVDEVFRNVAKWQEHAERAVRANDDELAKEALVRQAEAEKKLETAEGVLAEHSKMVAKMHQDLKSGETKLTEIKGKREALKNRARAAQKGTSGEGASAFDRFKALVEEIEDKEHQAEAMAEIEPELGAARQDDRDRETSQRFDRLLAGSIGTGTGTGTGTGKDPEGKKGPAMSQKDAEMDVRLAALKAKLDKRTEEV